MTSSHVKILTSDVTSHKLLTSLPRGLLSFVTVARVTRTSRRNVTISVAHGMRRHCDVVDSDVIDLWRHRTAVLRYSWHVSAAEKQASAMSQFWSVSLRSRSINSTLRDNVSEAWVSITDFLAIDASLNVNRRQWNVTDDTWFHTRSARYLYFIAPCWSVWKTAAVKNWIKPGCTSYLIPT